MDRSGALTRLQFGSEVSCTDGRFGELADVVIDPKRRRVTHLAVDTRELASSRLLAPIELAENRRSGPEIVLRCTVEAARKLPPVQDVVALEVGESPSEAQPDDPNWDVGVREVSWMPQSDTGAMIGYPESEPEMMMTYDRVPKGEIEIRHTTLVSTAEGDDAGRLVGVVVDGGQITQFLLQSGHLWRRRDLAVPIKEIDTLATDNVTLGLTRAQLRELRS